MPISLLINERTEGGKSTFCAHINQITEQIEAHVTIDHKGYDTRHVPDVKGFALPLSCVRALRS
jgi:hypothetical protein